MSLLGRALAALNPHASNPSTADRDKAARRSRREPRRRGSSPRSIRRAADAAEAWEQRDRARYR